MLKDYIQIDIPKPCDQKFSEMTPTHGGRYCDNCKKIIFDFTNLTDREIANAFHKNNGKICGQFRKSQLKREIDLSIPTLNSYRGKAAGILLTSILATGTVSALPEGLPPIEIVNGNVTLNLDENFSKQNKIREETDFLIDVKIIDNNNDGLIGAKISIKNTPLNFTTDREGKATLSIPSFIFEENSMATIIIKYMGFENKEINILMEELNVQPIIIKLDEAIWLIGEVVNIGYSRKKPIRRAWWKLKNFYHRQAENFSYFLEDRREIRKERRAKRKTQKAAKRIIKNEGIELISKPTGKIIQLPPPEYDTKINNIFLNPFSQEVNINITAKTDGDIDISIYEISGRLVYHAKQKVIKGQQNINIQLPELISTNAEFILQLREKMV